MFNRKKENDRDLSVPVEVTKAEDAREILRAWVANGGLVCSLRPETWNEPSAWGIALADVARHVANAVRALKGDDQASTLESIRRTFNSELADPTDEPTGRLD